MNKPQKIQELVYGIHPILELLRAKKRKIFTIYTTNPAPKAWDEIKPLLQKDVQFQITTKEVLNRIAGTPDHQGVVAWAGPFQIRKKFFDPERSPLLLMLDSIHDPRNMGAILRSAYCTGVDGVIICEKNAAPMNAVVLKSAAGLAEHLEIYQAPSAAAAAVELKKAGYGMYLATINGEDATTLAYTMPSCIVIGNEAVGVTKSLLSLGIQVTLPQKTTDISYNASVAAGILLFTVAHQLKKI
jgi:23S rRNA (guanosine2251-2'-O)-methyltransferase